VPAVEEEAPRTVGRESVVPAEMIRFSCEECGKAMQAKAQYAGRVTKCPNCGLQQPIPSNEEEDEAPVATRIQAERPAPRRGRDEDEEDERAVARRRRDDDEDEDDRRATRRRDEDERDRNGRDDEEDRGSKRKRGKKKQRSMLPLILGVAAGVFLLVSVGAAAGIYYLFFSGGGDLATWVPGDGQAFVTIRVADLWKQDEIQKVSAEVRKHPEFENAFRSVKSNSLGPADIERMTFVVQDGEN
jgi:hypothetical protein